MKKMGTSEISQEDQRREKEREFVEKAHEESPLERARRIAIEQSKLQAHEVHNRFEKETAKQGASHKQQETKKYNKRRL